MGWIILGAIMGLVLNIIFSIMFQNAAEEKGWMSKKYFWLCFFFGVIGYCLVAALPDRRACNTREELAKTQPEESKKPNSPFVPGGDEWRCPECGRINKNYVSSCACGATKRFSV